jgi:hypothetical protein
MNIEKMNSIANILTPFFLGGLFGFMFNEFFHYLIDLRKLKNETMESIETRLRKLEGRR